MAKKQINVRLQQKHDIENNWITAGQNGFIPLSGEIIIYDIDDNYSYIRIKIGDGITNINNLTFIDEAIWEQIRTMNQVVAILDENGILNFGVSPLARAEESEF